MRALVVERPGELVIREVEDPRIGDFEALVRIKACSICSGTDMKILEGHFPPVEKYPVLLGHEGVGEVIRTGKRVTSFKIGDIVLEAASLKDLSGITPAYGSFAEYAVAGDWAALREAGKEAHPDVKAMQVVPEGIDPNEATILITLKETLSGLLNFGLREGMSVIIYGDGCVGCSLVQFARLLGAEFVAGIGHWDKRLEKMKKLGADCVINEKKDDVKKVLSGICSGKADIVIDAVGRETIVNKGLSLIKNGGRVGMYGVNVEPKLVINLLAMPNNTSIQKLFEPVRREDVHNRVIRYVTSGDINLKDYYSHIIGFDEVERGFDLIRTREAFKVIVEMER